MNDLLTRYGRWDAFRTYTTGNANAAGVEVSRADDGGYRVEIAAPGYKPEQIDVTLEDAVLTVAGKTERRQFTRSLLLPDDIDGENVAAHVENGLLTLTLNVHAKAQPKKIAVTTSVPAAAN